MPVPTDYIFTPGSCKKSEIFDLIVNKLKAEGWTNVSSHPSTDFVVLTSTGNTENKNLVLQLRKGNAAATAGRDVDTTAYCQMSYRLQDTYTPGTAGAAGVFGRPSLAWTDLYITPVAANGTLATDTIVNYKMYADASKIILAIEYPSATGYNPVLIYMGAPDTSFMPQSANSSTILATSNTTATAASVMVTNSPDGIGNVAAPYALATSSLLPTKSPNNGGKYIVSDIYYGSATEGMRGKLDGILCALNTNLLTGDNITIGTQTYYVLCCATQGSTSFPSQAILVRIS
ncbi:hypothetical protein [Sporomusa sp. KB1]|jgi:hypothetical protein|uniref:hypothetical protein n=1 Tax=Sporomusa sp. KB1 TaxID=943346 RepID=UPI0011A720BF|nr:hypothetical protein [Sporomusa sp. KB1]TWH48565.1 hypothetical protein Salpa_4730 [Sporomusa sp. KB1]